jgi:tetrahydroxynaphthalene reductase
MFKAAQDEFGRLDIVVSNSGIEHFAEIPDVTGEDIDAVFAVNVKGQFFVAQQAYKYMEDYGRVMLTSSISAVKVCHSYLMPEVVNGKRQNF